MVAEWLSGLANAPYVVSAWLLTYLFHSTALIGGAWLVALLLARVACRAASVRSALPSLREKLWKFALVGGLVTASLQTVFGLDPWGARIGLRTRVEPTAVADARSAAGAELDADARITAVPIASADESLPRTVTISAWHDAAPRTIHDAIDRPRSEPIVDASQDIDRRVSLERAAPMQATTQTPTFDTAPGSSPAPIVVEGVDTAIASSTPTWMRIFLGVWLAGVALGVARWICQWNRLLRDLDDRSPVLSGTVWEVYQHLRARTRSLPNVRLSMSPGIRAPITLGLRRVEICLPPRVATELQRDEIAALLAHELAHARRRDPAWLALCRFVEVVFFFQPLNRLCASWLSDEAEYLCDDYAIVVVGERVALASCLTEIAGWLVHGDEPRLAPGMAAAGTRLSLRVGRLLDEDHDPRRAPRTRWVAVALAPVALSVAGLVPRVSADAVVEAPTEALAFDAHVDDARESAATETTETTETSDTSDTSEAPETSESTETSVARDRELESPSPASAPATIAVVSPEAFLFRAPSAPAPTPGPGTLAVHSAYAAFGATASGAALTAANDEEDVTAVLESLRVELDGLRERLDERGGCDSLSQRIDAMDEQLIRLRLRAADVQARFAAFSYAVGGAAEAPSATPIPTPSFWSKD